MWALCNVIFFLHRGVNYLIWLSFIKYFPSEQWNIKWRNTEGGEIIPSHCPYKLNLPVKAISCLCIVYCVHLKKKCVFIDTEPYCFTFVCVSFLFIVICYSWICSEIFCCLGPLTISSNMNNLCTEYWKTIFCENLILWRETFLGHFFYS